MSNKDLDKLMECIDSVKKYSGCDEVKLVGNSASLEKLIAMGFPLTNFQYEKVVECEEAKLYIIPIDKMR